MAIGPGRYDKECEELCRDNGCELVGVIAIGGIRGPGFSVAGSYNPLIHKKPPAMLMLPKLLRDMADEIEKDLAGGIART